MSIVQELPARRRSLLIFFSFLGFLFVAFVALDLLFSPNIFPALGALPSQAIQWLGLGCDAALLALTIGAAAYVRFRRSGDSPLRRLLWTAMLAVSAIVLWIPAAIAALAAMLVYCGMIDSHVGYCRLDL
jgi:UPF0716 family protein affecting phage T7 exclusion